MASYDGSIMIETKVDSSGVQKGIGSINKQAKTMKTSFAGIGKAVAAAFAVVEPEVLPEAAAAFAVAVPEALPEVAVAFAVAEPEALPEVVAAEPEVVQLLHSH